MSDTSSNQVKSMESQEDERMDKIISSRIQLGYIMKNSEHANTRSNLDRLAEGATRFHDILVETRKTFADERDYEDFYNKSVEQSIKEQSSRFISYLPTTLKKLDSVIQESEENIQKIKQTPDILEESLENSRKMKEEMMQIIHGNGYDTVRLEEGTEFEKLSLTQKAVKAIKDIANKIGNVLSGSDKSQGINK